MKSQPGEQTVAIHNILTNISRNKRNQTMKLGQLIANNMRSFLLKKSYTKSSPDPFLKPKIEHITGSTV